MADPHGDASSGRTADETDPPPSTMAEAKSTPDAEEVSTEDGRWYAGVTGYEWLVLVIACAGWMFDVYEGQIFNITRNDMLREILGQSAVGAKFWGDVFLAVFLAGGTIGGLLFGSLADRFGRRPIMIVTILMYSLFSGLTYFANDIYTVGVLRFLVALGIGGEWAVAAALVSEVFPTRARAHASAIFHASSILGTWLAAVAGILVGTHWRYAYLIGVIPALLIIWVRLSLKEPKRWQKTDTPAARMARGSFRELLFDKRWQWRAAGGMLLGAVGLGTFWSVTVAGQDLMRELLQSNGMDAETAGGRAKFAYGIVQATGGGAGLLAFGPLCARFGRRPTFMMFQIAALVIVPITCFLPQTYWQLLVVMPLFGFLTLGMHSGFAIYFPELFPTHIRATGASFCFNGGRLLAVPILIFSGWLKGLPTVGLPLAVTGLSLLFLVGIAVVTLLPETRGRDLLDS